ncbi:MAG: ribosome assembly cofactor RimP [Maribacter sp.]|nr:ribosome assembly cofactor RimP [Maribacter sp.]
MLKDKVAELLNQALIEDESLFLIDFSITSDNKIKVVLDGDSGVTVEDCVKISRAIEHNIDREEEDFSLEVTSAGAASPIRLPRQFKKNIGRKVHVATFQEDFEGNLAATEDDGIILEWKAREPKPTGKGKITVQKRKEIKFSEIKEAKVVLKF